tara:strand:+ start:170 stop:694 length:525 start_codon:yes stop_codon:yes gene_type:complete
MLDKPKVFVLDVDGVLTTGQFFYTEDGKYIKCFGPDDNDGLSLLKGFMDIRFITGDKRGFNISHKRIVEDMNYKLDLVSTIERVEWLSSKYSLKDLIYMGDGIFDHLVMSKVAYSIAPSNADKTAKKYADYVTERRGGDRAVAEACLHILDKFFPDFDYNKIKENSTNIGNWAV